ncbi:MAG: hypothetical protein JOZ04_11305 [Acidimicrobiia bacterium]|nr:hypothetical protein [Acidimicrobiia bacterium]
MPAIDDVLILERQSARLGVLWRSQGRAFLDEQAAELQEDVERLREAYLAAAESSEPSAQRRPFLAPKVIDLRDPEVSGLECSTGGHGHVGAVARCSRCRNVYCDTCILLSQATRGHPLCTECALVVAGVHHKRTRPIAGPARKTR